MDFPQTSVIVRDFGIFAYLRQLIPQIIVIVISQIGSTFGLFVQLLLLVLITLTITELRELHKKPTRDSLNRGIFCIVLSLAHSEVHSCYLSSILNVYNPAHLYKIKHIRREKCALRKWIAASTWRTFTITDQSVGLLLVEPLLVDRF